MNLVGSHAGELWALFAIAGGAVTLLYLFKRRRRRIEVPFSPLWAKALGRQGASRSLFKKLQRPLSLLLQLVIVGALLLALGDPRLVGAGGCAYQQPPPPVRRHTLLVIDASASMATIERGRTRLERARVKAHSLIDALAGDPNHRVMVVQLDARTRPRSLWTSDARALHAAVDAVASGGALDTPTAIDAALDLAEAALRGEEGASLVLVSDAAFSPIDKARSEALSLSLIQVGEPGVNLGVEAFNIRPHLDDALTYSIFYAVRGDVGRPVDATLFLYANDEGQSAADFVDPARIVASYAITVPAEGRVEAVIPDVKFEGSRLALRVVIDPADPARDVFPRDDTAFALVPERERLRVQFVTEGNLFLEASLSVRENVTLETVAPADYAGPGGFDVTIVDAGVGVDLSPPGDYLLIAPRPGGPFTLKGILRAPQVGRVAKRHPIARNLTLVDLGIAQALKLERRRGDKVVVAAQGGAPLLMTRVDEAGQRRFVVLAFDLRESLLPMSYAFPLLMVNVLSWFHQERAGLLEPRRAGVELSLSLNPDGAREASVAGDEPRSPVRVVAPRGAPAVHARRVGERVTMVAERVGIYEISTSAEARTSPVAVNLLSPQESRISPRAEGYPPWAPPTEGAHRAEPWLSPLWRVLLLAALGLVLIEWLSWHRRLTV